MDVAKPWIGAAQIERRTMRTYSGTLWPTVARQEDRENPQELTWRTTQGNRPLIRATRDERQQAIRAKLISERDGLYFIADDGTPLVDTNARDDEMPLLGTEPWLD